MPTTTAQRKISNRAIRRAFGAEALETIAQTVDKVNLQSKALIAFSAKLKEHDDLLLSLRAPGVRGSWNRFKFVLAGK